MKSEIIKLRKKIYKNLKEKAFSYEGNNPELQRYLKDQNKYSKRKFKTNTMDTLKEKVLAADVTYLGDFHTFDQNIRNVLRIVKFMLTQDNSNCILGLEMIKAKYQLYVDAYLERHITDLEFLECINYHHSWRFPWTHYKLIFELAKEHNIKVVALNTEGSLTERDEFAANLLQEVNRENPNSKLLVLYGELHITPNKIPSLLKAKCPQLKQVIVHQNLDEVYWELIKSDKEQGIISFSEKEFCIISAPPWIKYESMIYWYENLCDDPDFDIHEYIIENGKKIFSEDIDDNFFHICQELTTHLKLNIDEDQIEDFNLYDHTNLDFVEKKLKLKLRPALFKFYQYLISSNKSFRFPMSNTFYCSSYSMNRISYLGGIHIFHQYLELNEQGAMEILNSRSSVNKLILFTFDAMFAFLFSKVINPHRKCDMYLDLEILSNVDGISQHNKSVLGLALSLFESEDLQQVLKGKKLEVIYEASLLFGHILGEYLYLSLAKNNNSINLEEQFLNKKICKKLFLEIRGILLNDRAFKDHQKRYF